MGGRGAQDRKGVGREGGRGDLRECCAIETMGFNFYFPTKNSAALFGLSVRSLSNILL